MLLMILSGLCQKGIGFGLQSNLFNCDLFSYT